MDADSLIARARRAQDEIAEMSIDERLARLAGSATRVMEERDAIVGQAVTEVGQPRKFATREVESARALLGALPAFADAIRPSERTTRSGSLRIDWQPFGVILGWHAANSPVWVPVVVAASALVAGNAVISRPSRRTIRTTTRVIDVLSGGWPEGSVQTIDVHPVTAERLLAHEGIDAVVAHCSTDTCKRHLGVLGKAYGEDGSRLRPYIPEASGNDALIVLDGADLDLAAAAAALAGFANGGQLCMAAKRLIVEAAVWERFRPRLLDAVHGLVLGEADHPATDIAPLREGPARRQARAMLADALTHGGRIIAGHGEDGPFVTPTLVELPAGGRDCLLWREECFAPVRGLVVAPTAHAAFEYAADTRFGLGLAVFGPVHVAEALASRARVARVAINTSPLLQDPTFVVGGVRDSGYGGARPKLEQFVYPRRTHRT